MSDAFRTPPVIWHKDKPEHVAAEQIAAAASDNLRLSKRETKLLLYYCSQAKMFTPSLKRIEQMTGIAANKVWETQDKLCKKMLIFREHGKIIIDWWRLRAFAMMERQPKSGALRAKYGGGSGRRVKTIGEMLEANDRDEDALKSIERHPQAIKDTDPFMRALLHMTEGEYYKWLEFPFPAPTERRPVFETVA